jgi:hypothetical protein
VLYITRHSNLRVEGFDSHMRATAVFFKLHKSKMAESSHLSVSSTESPKHIGGLVAYSSSSSASASLYSVRSYRDATMAAAGPDPVR